MDELRVKYIKAIANAKDEIALEEVRLAALGKKGEVSLQMRELGKMPHEERQVAGPSLNAIKDEINSALNAKKECFSRCRIECTP
jgi:phenylalanyl-tRNA synthetase alpha chain